MTVSIEDSINTLPFEELIKLRDTIEERITRVRRTEQNSAKKKIAELARAYGIEVSFAQAAEAASTAKRPAKYQNPENAEQTWTGIGKKPLWVYDLMSKGHKLEEFLIQSENS